MSEKEKLILKHIKQNPFISQNELASSLGLSRSAVAGYISSLMKQGKILGKAYILQEDSHIVCIGGSNVDRKAKPIHSMELGTSNPVSYYRTPGGVARNVAENLGRLETSTSLITTVGDDNQGKWLLEHTIQHNVDVSQSFTINNQNTGSYTIILDNNGEMLLGLDDMELYNKVTFNMIKKRWSHICAADIIFLDLNFSKEVIEETIKKCNLEKHYLCVSPISSSRVDKLPADLTGIELLILNSQEATELSSIYDCKNQDYKSICQELQKRGCPNIIISLGSQGVYLGTKDKQYIHLPTQEMKPVDQTGGRDALIAGVLYGVLQGKSLAEACQIGMAMTILTIETPHTVHPELTIEKLESYYREFSSHKAAD